ncbi:sensor histidine kinase [Pseudobacteroides cellulosolvens]|uniref:Oxygen sensor histidine kinase NreB n=1 Tax=Pseudobacteroides cellulosolvens ATCC 35603 = DSM 2933 TaxID=398512 RepID=A0A0L6JGU9_9FIRM|nr:sensor histidine kinase [Pseudobacteroides cellulosolvens]KNY25091.1 DegS sensor signal transduction histidine kinase [Pseudobacteroides cellulosolvens ATCC 35603 = DSM 2933]
MANYKFDASKMDEIIKKVVDAINGSKKEICEIAEGARKEHKNLVAELELLKTEAAELIKEVDEIEKELQNSRKKLMVVNKNFEKFSQEELKQAYEKADNLRIELVIKREKEKYFIKRRNDLEVRIKEVLKTVQRADNLMAHVGVAMEYLCGDLINLGNQIEDMQQRQVWGFRIIKAQEDERQRVAREIHDGPAQSMSNVVLKAEICEKLIDVDIEKARFELQNLKRIVRESLVDVRKIIYNLRPMSLDDLGLVPTLQRYISTFQEENKIDVLFKSRGSISDIRSVISLTVFRIVQEALNNIRKHAKANSVSVNIEFIEDKLRLSINDDGVGFDVESLKVKHEDIESGFGLFSMKERVELLDGEFNISSRTGSGTRLSIMIPLKQNEGDADENN